MKKALAVKKNLDLLNEFMKYAFDNPKVLEEIPAEAELIILPIDDPDLYEYNRKTAISAPELELMPRLKRSFPEIS
jgi:hypothetical protein